MGKYFLVSAEAFACTPETPQSPRLSSLEAQGLCLPPSCLIKPAVFHLPPWVPSSLLFLKASNSPFLLFKMFIAEHSGEMDGRKQNSTSSPWACTSSLNVALHPFPVCWGRQFWKFTGVFPDGRDYKTWCWSNACWRRRHRLFWRGDLILVQNPRLEEDSLAGLRQRFPELEPGGEGPLPREEGKFSWGRARWWDPHRAYEQESALGRSFENKVRRAVRCDTFRMG